MHRHTKLYASALAIVLAACGTKDEPPRLAATRPAPSALPYPRAAWRLADPKELERTALWTSHILITHADSSPATSELRPLDWAPDAFVNRSRADAIARATEIMRQARTEPGRFAELARQHSEDRVTRDRGGSLGPLWATWMPPAFLDGLAVLRPGEVSHVITTILGYHVILKRSPPPKQDVAGQHVVIRYRGTFGFGPSTRSRAEALQLARKVLVQARAGAAFTDLVARYSEADDRTRSGDMGVYATTEPGTHARVIEALAELDVGQTLPEPIDTHFGFQIVRRVAVTTRTECAARLVRFSFEPGTSQETDARRQADAAAARRRRDPASLRGEAGVERLRWFDGRGDATLTNVVEKLDVGQSTPLPARLHDAYAVIERVDPADICSHAQPRYELPGPQWLDIETMMARGSAAEVRPILEQLRGFIPALQLAASDASALDHAITHFSLELGAAHDPEAVRSAYRSNMIRLRNQISEASYARVSSGIQQWLGQQLLEPK